MVAPVHIDLSDQLLAEPAYAFRYRPRGYTHKMTALGPSRPRDAANILIRANPSWTRTDHRRLAEMHRQAEKLQMEHYGRALDSAAFATFGRPFHVFDYRICCIGSEEFSDDQKEVIRYHGYAIGKHRVLAYVHDAAAASRRLG